MSVNSNKSTPGQFEFDFDTLSQSTAKPEPLLTIAEACALFNLKPHVLRRAVKAKSVGSYRIGNARIRLRVSDIEAAIVASRNGGAKK